MIKTLHNVLKRDRERFTIPKTVQDIIPVKTIWNDGIFKVGNLFSKTFQFSDINYAMLSAEDTKDLFLKYSDVINSFEYGATYKLTIALERYNQKALQESVLMPMREDELDRLRKESNARITHDAMSAGNFRHLRYLTVSAYKRILKRRVPTLTVLQANCPPPSLVLDHTARNWIQRTNWRCCITFFARTKKQPFSLTQWIWQKRA